MNETCGWSIQLSYFDGSMIGVMLAIEHNGMPVDEAVAVIGGAIVTFMTLAENRGLIRMPSKYPRAVHLAHVWREVALNGKSGIFCDIGPANMIVSSPPEHMADFLEKAIETLRLGIVVPTKEISTGGYRLDLLGAWSYMGDA